MGTPVRVSMQVATWAVRSRCCFPLSCLRSAERTHTHVCVDCTPRAACRPARRRVCATGHRQSAPGGSCLAVLAAALLPAA